MDQRVYDNDIDMDCHLQALSTHAEEKTLAKLKFSNNVGEHLRQTQAHVARARRRCSQCGGTCSAPAIHVKQS